ncbi:hypothetical protein DV451_001222 [Geotrichum candidum]|uniref:Aspartokinase n=1 Tax=Geotrichum candidum TaxID=1173061 RepID=A0A9P5G999_GEOCN|nr:hypothetical protein DV451_001222 [Geotrichum candidum]KAF5106968.1 hypothetical protein DV453_003458 [Geotrichum candidum]
MTKSWIVQKFGGTSVGKFPLDIANDIVKVYSQDHRVAVVCSARSTDTKAEGTTTRLLAAADKALSGDDFSDGLEAIRTSHLAAARELIKSKELLTQLEADIERECNNVIAIISAARVIEEVSPRTLDSIISAGEKLSCLYMAALISDNGVPAKYVDLSHVIPSSYSQDQSPNQTGIDKDFYKFLVAQIKREIEACEGFVPIITGFFGSVPGGLLENVGRGYTDLCAALAAVAMEAEELQIWKEVDGIFTADPRKVPTARLLPIITPEEAAELTYYGSEVIHPFTMEQVINAHIPIRIKNVMNPKGSGTIVYPNNVALPGEATPPHPPVALEKLAASNFIHKKIKGPTAVTTKNNIIVLNVHSNRRDLSHGFLAHVFSILDKWKLVVDLISTSEVRVSMALHSSLSEPHFRDALTELRKYGTVDVTRKLCIVSLVGTQMKQSIGTAGQMFSTLAEAGVNIEMISQGASEINISAVIEQKDSLKALNVLHQRLLCQPKVPSLLNLAELNNHV